MPQLPSDLPALFTGRHFDRLLITQSVRWYITYKPSYRDVSEMMAERGVTVVHTALVQIGSQVEVGCHILGKAHRSFPISCMQLKFCTRTL